MVKCTGRGLVVKRLGVLSKVQVLNLVLGVGVFSPLPILDPLSGFPENPLLPYFLSTLIFSGLWGF